MNLTTSDKAQVMAHMEAIFASKPFANAPRLRRFLSFVVEKTLAGKGDEIKEFVVATEVYGRGSEYDPQIDSTVRVEASRLRGKLREFYRDHGPEHSVRIDLPKGSYVPVFQTLVTKEEDDSSAPPRNRWWVAGLVPLLAIASVFALRSTATAPDVYPLTAQAGEPPQLLERYFAADKLLRQRVFENGWPGVVPGNVSASISAFESITREAPGFARAWVGLGEAHEWAYELDKTHPRWRINAAKAALQRALEIDPKLPEAHSRLSAIYFYSDGDLPRAEASVKQAVALNPRDVRAQTRYADLLRLRGQSSLALERLAPVLAADPTATRVWVQRALLLYDLDRYEEAIDAARHSLEVNTGNQMNQFSIAHWVKGLCFERLGQQNAAEAEYRAVLEEYPEDSWNQPALGHLLAKAGRIDEARTVLSALIGQHQRGKPVAYGIALVHTGPGEYNNAIEWLERGRDASQSSILFAKLEKRFEPLRRIEQFASFLRDARA